MTRLMIYKRRERDRNHSLHIVKTEREAMVYKKVGPPQGPNWPKP